MHICFYNHALSDTGGVRVLLDMCRMFISRGDKVSLIVDRYDRVCFPIPAELDVFCISNYGLKKIDKEVFSRFHKIDNQVKNRKISFKSKIPKPLLSMAVKIKYLMSSVIFIKNKRYLFEQLSHINPDSFISLNMYNHLEYSELMSRVSPLFLHIHNDVYDVYKRDNFFSLVDINSFYNRVGLVCISNKQKDRLSEFFSIEKESIELIYNAIDFERIKRLSSEFTPKYDNYVVVVAALTNRKRVDRAIYALKFMPIDTQMIILGDGPLKFELMSFAESLKLKERVVFMGFNNNPYPYIKYANALILTSDFEGLPTVLIESLALNTPCISTDCPTGPSEILEGGNSVMLVSPSDDLDACSKEISEIYIKILSKEIIPEFDVLDKFREESVLESWIKLLEKRVC